ncbi:MAG: YfhO family protein [Leptospiraceae bacterium]|nr:YfhO family protein [Leptospiraceae bacterium]
MQFLKIYFTPLFFYLFVIGVFFKNILWGDNSLIIHDNLTFFYPAFLKGFTFWDSFLQLGFPIGHDPQYQTFYFLKYLFPKTEIGFTLYILSSILTASYFTFLLTHKLTEHLIGSMFAGLIFGFSGNFLGQLSMSGVTMTEAYLPVVVYINLLLFEKPSSKLYHLLNWVAIYLNISSGYPQASVFNLFFTYLFLFGFYQFKGRNFTKFLTIIGSGVIGILLCSMILLPTFELMQYSSRGKVLEKSSFNAYTFIWYDYIKILYPYFFGSIIQNESFSFLYQFAITGTHNFHEHQRYMGIIVLPLLAFSYKSIEDKKLRIVILGLLLFYILFTMGTNFIVGKLFFKLPIFNKLRGTNRHFLEISLIIAILSSYSIRRIQNFWSDISRNELILFFSMLISFILLPFLFISFIPELMIKYNNSFGSLLGNNLIMIQILFLGITGLLLVLQKYLKNWGSVLFLFLLFIDLFVVGTNQDWNLFQIKPHKVSNIEKLVVDNPQKEYAILTENEFPLSVFFIKKNNIDYPPVNHLHNNVNSIVGLKSFSIYSPLAFSDNYNLAKIARNNSYLSELFGVKYRSHRIEFNNLDFEHYSIFGKCIGKPFTKLVSTGEFNPNLPPIGSDKFAFYYTFLCLDNNDSFQPKITVTFKNEKKEIFETVIPVNGLALGILDCINPTGFYKKIRVDNDKRCIYLQEAEIQLPNGFIPTNFEVIPENIAIGIYAYKINRNGIEKYRDFIYRKSPPNSKVLYIDNKYALYELNNPKPEMYFPEKLETKTKLEIWDIFSRKDYSSEDTKTAYIETEDPKIQEKIKNFKQHPYNKIVNSEKIGYETNVILDLKTESFLVFNQTYFSGWEAFVDGEKTPILKTNYIVSGIFLPAGKHKVEFRYFPIKIYIGMGISICVLTTMSLLFGIQSFLNKKYNSKTLNS